jgi:S-DNA-T family DNA segregation ATPase FtsK/SpoIIIE
VTESVYERFRVAHVSAPYQEQGEVPEQPAARAELTVLGLRETPRPAEPEPAAGPAPVIGGLTWMQVIADRLQRFGQPVHQVWLPPLPPAIPLDPLLGPLTVEDARGLQASMWPLSGSLRFPVGVIDLPLSQEQQPLVLDFGQMHPHVVLVGAPQAGKSTFLRTVMLSAMLTHTPRELQFACLDYGGGSLHALAGAPHVSGVAVRGERERSQRVLAEALRLISQREELFRELGISSAAEFRQLRDAGELPGDVNAADVCIVIDNWGGLHADLPDVDTLTLGIAARGPGAGVHLLLTANRWGDIRIKLRDDIGARLELRLNDPSESEVNRRTARLVPSGLPGRGISPPGLLFHALLPRADGGESTDGLGEAQDEILAKITASWTGPPAPPVRLLPEVVHLSDLPPAAPAVAGQGALVAIGERDLAPAWIDLTGPDQHCLVIGDGGAGKSSFIRTWMRGLAAVHPPQAIRFMVVDYRRGLAGAVPAPYIGAYAGDAAAARIYAGQLADTLAGRMPPPGISPRELRQRSWWTGPDLYLVVDDYDLVAAMQSPLQPLIDYIAQGREIGFHVLVARGSSGIARTLMTDPVISHIRELGAAGMLLSADPREGVIIGGVRGMDLPPGRGVLVRRRQENELVQVVLSDEPQE